MKKNVAIIGGGTAGLFLAAFLNTELYNVTIFEKKPSPGRKFLVAGGGGFNVTHSEELSTFKTRYTPVSFLDNALEHFSHSDFRAWLFNLGIPTFVGSSGRVFPEKGIKPIAVLKRIEAHLMERNVQFKFNQTFTGWDYENSLVFNSNEIIKPDFTVFALGGASWKVTGSDGSWSTLFDKKGIATVPFKSSNCAFKINWDPKFIQIHEGMPLKNISISLKNKNQKGEAVITKFGIEGNAIYGLSPHIQSDLSSEDEAFVLVDFKPAFTLESLIEKISESKSNITTTLKDKIKLSRAKIDLLKTTLTKEAFLDVPTLAKSIKNFPLKIIGSAPIDEAISTSGGIDLMEVDANFELKKLKNQFCIGEMVDWDAPTGGYLIQGCVSSGAYLAHRLNQIR
ncbi:MAG: TIGR03862 family flavoprotein [Ginsengibacter sp.]